MIDFLNEDINGLFSKSIPEKELNINPMHYITLFHY